MYGSKGEVTGPARVAARKNTHVAVMFPGNNCDLDISFDELSRTAPTLPGDYVVGLAVFFTGPSFTFPSGDRVVYGGKGEVTGPARDAARKDTHVAVMFHGNNCEIVCSLDELSRTAPPALPGGFVVGLAVFYTGKDRT